MLRLEVKPNRWSCLATSMAMVLELATEEFYRLAGHDGSEVIYPWLAEPQNRRGFHIQEAVYVAMKLRYAMTPFELFPQLAPSSRQLGSIDPGTVLVRYDNDKDMSHNWYLFKELVRTGKGIIECETSSRTMHAVAYSSDCIFNPDGEAFLYSREACEARGLFTKRLWQVTKCWPNSP